MNAQRWLLLAVAALAVALIVWIALRSPAPALEARSNRLRERAAAFIRLLADADWDALTEYHSPASRGQKDNFYLAMERSEAGTYRHIPRSIRIGEEWGAILADTYTVLLIEPPAFMNGSEIFNETVRAIQWIQVDDECYVHCGTEAQLLSYGNPPPRAHPSREIGVGGGARPNALTEIGLDLMQSVAASHGIVMPASDDWNLDVPIEGEWEW